MPVVTARNEMANLVARFRQALCTQLHQQVDAFVGYRGGNKELTLRWSDDVQLWMAYDEDEDQHIHRYWTAFGLDKPDEGENMSIITEINFPMAGINRRIAGAFITSQDQGIRVAHRGKIGGGRHGIGLTLFWNNYRCNAQTFADGEYLTRFAVIGDLKSPHLAYQVRTFVAEVERIKGLRES